MLFGDSSYYLFGSLDFPQRHVDPDILQHIRNLAEQRVDALKAGRQQLMNAVFDGASVTHVVNEDRVVELADPLDAALSLFEPCRIPRQVEVDERSEALEIQTF